MACHLTIDQRVAWEARMRHYKPPANSRRRNLLDRTDWNSPYAWFHAMVGRPWAGSRNDYRCAVNAWKSIFGCNTFYGRFAHLLVDSRPAQSRTVTLIDCSDGLGLGFDDDHTIVAIYPNTPAASALQGGFLTVGDRVLAVDGIPLNDRRVCDVLSCQPTHTLTVVRHRDLATECIPDAFDCGALVDASAGGHMCRYCGAVLLPSETVTRKLATGEFACHGTHCCAQGSVAVPDADFSRFPCLRRWWQAAPDGTLDGQIGKCLRKYTRAINNALAMTSIVLHHREQSGWNPSVVIQGRLHTYVPSLQTEDGVEPAFAQLMVNDPMLNDCEVVDYRIGSVRLPASCSQREREHIGQILTYMSEMLYLHNPYAQDFALAFHTYKGCTSRVQLVIDPNTRPTNTHARSYNDVQAVPSLGRSYREMTVLMSEQSDPRHGLNRCLVVHLRSNNELVSVPYHHRSFDPLHYVILFPHGEDGHHRSLTCTALQFYAYKLQYRPDRPDGLCLLRAARLFAEYCCVAFARIEAERLDWHRNNQKSVRAELYHNLADHVYGDDDGRVGRKVILASSFLGGPRNQNQRFHDAMAIVRDRGKPSLFVTFTCNPNWPEILQSLLPGQQPHDRPDLSTRIFHAKFKQLMHDLTVDHVLGPVCAHLAVIEFQKRGLPHAHILLIFQSYARLCNATHVDKVVSAEIPEVPSDLCHGQTRKRLVRLQSLVCKHMLHNDCTVGRQCPCHDSKGKCTKNFPHTLCHETTWDDRCIYPQYRRRPFVGDPLILDGRTVNNRWVTPYNPWLLLKYDAHINVEVCVGQHCVKYLYKYVLKNNDRGDRTMVSLQPPDEVTQFQDMRSIGASEAVWRMLKFDLHSAAPAVVRLPVHLPNDVNVLYQEGDELRTVEAGSPSTCLTAWIQWTLQLLPDVTTTDVHDVRRLVDPRHNLLYVQMPSMFKWDHKEKHWTARRNDTYNVNSRPVGRMWYVCPTAGEQFYLSIMLCNTSPVDILEHVAKATITLTDARCAEVNLLRFGHETFQDACSHMGYLQGMREWERIMDHACYTQSSYNIRFVFITLLTNNDVDEPTALFNLFHAPMGDFGQHGPDAALRNVLDLWTQTPLSLCEWRRLLVLHTLAHELNELNVTLADVLLPTISSTEQALIDQLVNRSALPTAMQKELNYNPSVEKEKFENARSCIQTCESQNALLTFVVDNLAADRRFNIFIDAPGGTGKTYCLNAIMSHVRSQGKIVLAVATTGIAALLLHGGSTVHSRFALPLDIHATSTCNISVQSQLGQLLQSTDLIVYDEAPMHHRHVMEAIDRTLRDVRNSEEPFGGISLIMAGDFRQIAPIIPRSTDSMLVAAMLHQSPLWRTFRVFRLQENMRVKAAGLHGNPAELQRFADWLLSVGDGSSNRLSNTSAQQSEPQTCVASFNHFHITMQDADIQRMLDWTYPHMLDRLHDEDSLRFAFFADRLILAPHHSAVSKINTVALHTLPGATVDCPSADKVEENYPISPSYLHTLEESGLPPHMLQLKPNLPVVLMRNIRPSLGLCNGTRLLIKTVVNNAVIEAVIISGKPEFVGTTVAIPRIKLFGSTTREPYRWSRLQFPIKPAICMTVCRFDTKHAHTHSVSHLPHSA
jgi:hypothetical protein